MKPAYGTSRSPKGLTLQAKLTLAFVLVSLVGFVVAFQMLPRLVIRSWTQEVESAKEPNLEKLHTFYAGLGPSESVKAWATGLGRSEEFDVEGIEFPENGLAIEDFVEQLEQTRIIPTQSIFLSIVRDLRERFTIVRIFPHRVPPLSERLAVLVDREAGGAYYLPLIAPLETADGEFEGSLVVGGYGGGLGNLNPYDISEDFTGLALMHATADDLAYISAQTFEDSDPEILQRLLEDSEQAYLDLQGERKDLFLQLIPLFDIEVGPDGKNEVLGFFAINYKRPVEVFAWTELLSGEGYSAVASSALVALVFSFIFAKGITRPVKVLTASATAFAEGRLDEPVVTSSRDEIGILAATFNEMRQRLQTTLKELQERAETIEHQKEELDVQFKSLQILQNYTENVLASVDSAIFSIDVEGEVRSRNRAAQQLLGFEEGCLIEEALSESLAERLKNSLDYGETTFSEEMTVESPSGETVPVAVSVSPLREGDSIVGAVAVLTDLSVIKNLEATVSRQERLAALGQLTAGVAHEIRNPLSIIKACAEILQEKFQGRPGEDGLCSDIIAEADRLSRVVSEFLTFARPSAPNRAPVHLNDLLAQILDRFDLTLPPEVRIERRFDPDLPEVEADSDQLEQVLLNLVRNAVEAMEGSGSVVVRSGSCEGESSAWVEVEDRGNGMDEETRRRAFDPFYTSKAQGTGLGLSICHRILESHGGSIQIRETKPGVGTVFRITLPVGEREPVS